MIDARKTLSCRRLRWRVMRECDKYRPYRYFRPWSCRIEAGPSGGVR